MVERAFARIMKNRRLARDYEQLTAVDPHHHRRLRDAHQAMAMKVHGLLKRALRYLQPDQALSTPRRHPRLQAPPSVPLAA